MDLVSQSVVLSVQPPGCHVFAHERHARSMSASPPGEGQGEVRWGDHRSGRLGWGVRSGFGRGEVRSYGAGNLTEKRRTIAVPW